MFSKTELPAPVKIAKPELPVPVGVNDNRVHYIHGKNNAAADEVKGDYETPLRCTKSTPKWVKRCTPSHSRNGKTSGKLLPERPVQHLEN